MRQLTMQSLVAVMCWHATMTLAAEPARPATGFFPGSSPAERKIYDALDNQTSVSFRDTPMHDVLSFMQQQHQINLVIDRSSIEQAGIARDQVVSLELSGIRLRTALRIILSEFKLDFVVRDDALFVTSALRAEQWLTTRTYPVRDLIYGHGDSWEQLMTAVEAAAGTEWKSADNRTGGSMAPVPEVGALVVTQNDRGHEAVVDLLNSLRRADQIDAIEAGTGTEHTTGFVTFDRVVMNLNDPKLIKYLTLEIVLVVEPNKRQEMAVLLERHKPRLKHRLTSVVADRKVEDVMGADGIEKLRTDIAEEFNLVIAGKKAGPVSEVLFDEWHID